MDEKGGDWEGSKDGRKALALALDEDKGEGGEGALDGEESETLTKPHISHVNPPKSSLTDQHTRHVHGADAIANGETRARGRPAGGFTLKS